ncbi:MAG: hypothetical protein J1E62_04385 [Lachnospiraceae bacterium]|nr:hypothetical protein [Lachnospiraceae bacterium]
MNHRIPLCFVTIVLSLCLCIVFVQKPLFAKSNLSSAGQLPMDKDISIRIAAYDMEYFYFWVPTTLKNKNQHLLISLSNSKGISLVALDSTGKEIALTKSNQSYQLPSGIDTGDRCFLRISNSLPENQTLSVRIFCVSTNASSPTPKAKTSTRSQTGKKTPKPSGNSKTQKGTSKASENSQAKKGSSSNSNSGNSKKPLTRTPIPNLHQEPATRKPISTSKPVSESKSSRRQKAEDPLSEPSLPGKHFIRIQRGTSLALAEHIFESVPKVPIIMKASSEEISVANGIIYVPKEGLYYVILQYANIHTTCTIKVD